MLTNLQKAPFPYYGGKRDAAPAIWRALGDPMHLVDPFMGSLAVLLERPHPCNRPYYSETVNDLDGFLCNAWRSIQFHPDETAEWASWPVSECDCRSREVWLLKWLTDQQTERLQGDPEFCDPRAAGYWLHGLCSHIGGFCTGTGPWTVDPSSGRIFKQERGERSTGVNGSIPHLSNNGQGVNHAGLREPGVNGSIPHLSNNGQGVNHAGLREPGTGDPEFHPMTMPELLRWFRWLSARLRHVRILCGDWRRALTGGATLSLSVRKNVHSGRRHPDAVCGIILDPPYSTEAGRDMALYRQESGVVAHDVRAWCLEHGDDERYRIVLCGYEGEHEELEGHGWRAVEWFKRGFLKGGRGQLATARVREESDDEKAVSHQQGRERLWLSPHCLADEPEKQGVLL